MLLAGCHLCLRLQVGRTLRQLRRGSVAAVTAEGNANALREVQKFLQYKKKKKLMTILIKHTSVVAGAQKCKVVQRNRQIDAELQANFRIKFRLSDTLVYMQLQICVCTYTLNRTYQVYPKVCNIRRKRRRSYHIYIYIYINDHHYELTRSSHVRLSTYYSFLRYRIEILHKSYLSEPPITDHYSIQLPYKLNDRN